jgi:hypothetical protein
MIGTALGAFLGFAGSALGPLAEYFGRKENNKLEINKLEQAALLAQAGFTQDQVMMALKSKGEEHARLISHDIAISKTAGFIGGIQKLVRPVITYSFFGMFAVVEWSILDTMLNNGVDFATAMQYLWDEETQVIFATVISFWFGDRVFQKRREYVPTQPAIVQ